MTTTAVSPISSFSESFFASLYELPDGERIRTCLQCGMCGGVCPFGYAMEFPPNKMIATLRADVFDRVIEDRVGLDVHLVLCLHPGLPVQNPADGDSDDPRQRRTAAGRQRPDRTATGAGKFAALRQRPRANRRASAPTGPRDSSMLSR